MSGAADGGVALYTKANTSWPGTGRKICPCLIMWFTIDRPNQVWTTDLNCTSMAKSYVHASAIMCWYSPRVLSWRTSSAMDTDLCAQAPEEIISRYGTPDIFGIDPDPGLPVTPPSAFSRRAVSRSAWTACVVGWKMCLWNGCCAA